MNVDLGIWGKLTRMVTFLLFLAVVLIFAVPYLPLIRTNERYRQELMRYDEKIRKQEEIGKQLRTSIDALCKDPKAVERLARESFGYAKAGETVIRFEPATNSIPRR